MMEQLFCEYTKWVNIFAIKAPLQIFHWAIYMPPKIKKFSK